MTILEFSVEGEPKAQPRPRLKRHGRAYNPRGADAWKKLVALKFREAKSKVRLHLPVEGPVGIEMDFVFARPPGHFRQKDGQRIEAIKRAAPRYHVQTPDGDNLAKAVMDTLTRERLWKDDSQAVVIRVTKRWSLSQTVKGANISISKLDQ